MTQLLNHGAIRARGLAKCFGPVQAVSCIDLDVAPGEVLIFGHAAGSAEARAVTGATPQSTGFPDQLTPRELLTYAAARYGTNLKVDDFVARFGLEKLIDRRVSGFSGGEMRRVALALAFTGSPKLVFLDEPTTGLDIAAQEEFREAARDYIREGGALVLTSHHWDEVEAICDAITLIDRGESVLSGRIDDIRARTTINRFDFALPSGTEPPEWMQATHHGQRWRVQTGDSDTVLRRMVLEGLPFEGLMLESLNLKDLIDRIRKEETIK